MCELKSYCSAKLVSISGFWDFGRRVSREIEVYETACLSLSFGVLFDSLNLNFVSKLRREIFWAFGRFGIFCLN